MLPLLSFILITHNRRQDAADAIRSVCRLSYLHKEIILVDNASTDGTGEYIRELFPDITILHSSVNTGVAGGRNLGITAAAGEVCVFMDDDAEFLNEQTGHIIQSLFGTDPRLGIIAFKILNHSDGLVHKHEFPGRNTAMQHERFETSYFIGCGFAVSRRVLDVIGAFKEAFFYAAEEIDFSYRAIDAGFRIVYEPSIEILHKKNMTTRPAGQWYERNLSSRYLLTIQNLPFRYLVPHLIIWHVYVCLRSLRHGAFRSFLRGIFRGIRSIPTSLKHRKTLQPDTIAALRLLRGRLWY